MLYYGTRLRWTGAVLEIESNSLPRRIELRAPDGRVVARQLDGPSAVLA